MIRDDILRTLSAHMPAIRAFGVSRLALFGSLARGEGGAESDADILVEFTQPVGFFTYARLQRYLEGIIGRPVDLVTPGAIRPEMRDTILGEALYAA
jgi:predicted nucleotidyltransferase